MTSPTSPPAQGAHAETLRAIADAWTAYHHTPNDRRDFAVRLREIADSLTPSPEQVWEPKDKLCHVCGGPILKQHTWLRDKYGYRHGKLDCVPEISNRPSPLGEAEGAGEVANGAGARRPDGSLSPFPLCEGCGKEIGNKPTVWVGPFPGGPQKTYHHECAPHGKDEPISEVMGLGSQSTFALDGFHPFTVRAEPDQMAILRGILQSLMDARADAVRLHKEKCDLLFPSRPPSDALSKTYMLPMDVEAAIAWFDSQHPAHENLKRYWKPVRAFIHEKARAPSPLSPQTGEANELVKRLRELHKAVAYWPEKLPDGWTRLLELRNAVPEAADALERMGVAVRWLKERGLNLVTEHHEATRRADDLQRQVDEALAKYNALGQFLAHVRVHLTQDENFDADEFEHDFHQLEGGQWIDTENLLFDERQKVAELQRQVEQMGKVLDAGDELYSAVISMIEGNRGTTTRGIEEARHDYAVKRNALAPSAPTPRENNNAG